MVSLKIDRGLDIPIEGKPLGDVQDLKQSSNLIALDMKPFSATMKLRLLQKPGETVAIGDPIIVDKTCEERAFVSPAGGVIKDVIRGEKRRIEYVVIERSSKEEEKKYSVISPSAPREELVKRMLEGGVFTRIRRRPFDTLAMPNSTPKAIFIRAVESAPFVPAAEMQVEGHEEAFAEGVEALTKFTEGHVHVVHRKGSNCKAFTGAKNAKVHAIEGPHPAGNVSTHIHLIDPITSIEDVVWTLDAEDVVYLGYLLRGKHHVERVIGLGGTGFHEDRRGFYKVRVGCSMADIIANRNIDGEVRFISGDVLTGTAVTAEGFLGFRDTCVSALKENTKRELFHFFRPGFNKFTASKAYVSGMLKGSGKQFDFTTSQHGEERAFVDGAIYDKVFPMQVPVMMLVKAVIAEDFEQAEELGLLEVAAQDFALPTFVCPCKIEMLDIMEKGLQDYAKEILG
jgi:Na+-transporting NADH:ubiquinone oxidoreductase subunit A